MAADTLLEIPLPAEWVGINDADLRSDSSAAAIDGFQLRLDGAAPMPGVIMGFQSSNETDVLSSLRVTTSRDTVDFPVYEVFAGVRYRINVRPDGTPLTEYVDRQRRYTGAKIDTEVLTRYVEAQWRYLEAMAAAFPANEECA